MIKIAREKRSQANSAFLWFCVLLKMLVKSRSITAKAQGLILSANAAGTNMAKKLKGSIEKGERLKVFDLLFYCFEMVNDFVFSNQSETISVGFGYYDERDSGL